jgi:NADPH:quinone reductase-like Zn-dependent oxidoreductase
MKAAVVSAFGEIDQNLNVVDDWPRPSLILQPEGWALVQVLACSIAPGDWRVLSGETSLFQRPKSFPYVAGGDVCGVVLQVQPGEKHVKVGDVVVAQFEGTGPSRGLAERALVLTETCVIKPPHVSSVEAAALGSSAPVAMFVARQIKAGERVLVLGGAGGIGTILLQLLKVRSAGFIAATSRDTGLLLSLGVDRAIDYTKEDVWSIPEFMRDDGKFDVIVDLHEKAWPMASQGAILKSARKGGRFLTTVVPAGRMMKGRTYREAAAIVLPLLGTLLRSACSPWRPRYKITGRLHNREDLQEVCALVAKGTVRVVVDSDHTFTTEGVRAAFHKQRSHHAHGKVVVTVANQPTGATNAL